LNKFFFEKIISNLLGEGYSCLHLNPFVKIDAEKRRIEAVIQQSLLEQQIVQQEPEQDPGQETQF